MDTKLSFAFFGTPTLTITLLEALKSAGLVPKLIVTTPDKPQGRKLILTPPPVKLWAIKNNIPFLQPEKLNAEFIEKMRGKNFDLFVVVAYGKILPEELINLPLLGTLNVHYSLLPKYRGATPVESAILSGDSTTGVCIQKMKYKLDTGPILDRRELAIEETLTAPVLRETLNAMASEMLPVAIKNYVTGNFTLTEQDDTLATNCHKIEKEDGLLNLSDEDMLNYRKFRAHTGWPGSYYFITEDGKQTRIIIKSATLQDGVFTITRVIPEGKKETDYPQFLKTLL